MATAEPKQRRAGCTAVDAGASKDELAADTESANKGKKHAGALKATLQSTCNGLRRRSKDILGVATVLVSDVAGYAYVTNELLLEVDSGPMQLVVAVGHVLFLWMVLNWLGTVIWGPGRVPAKAPAVPLQPVLASALEVGRFAPLRPFNSLDGYCFECSRWKPALAHHCKTCNSCSVWMDHHCAFVAQCIGFRNFRCFVLFLANLQALLVLLLLMGFRRLFVEPEVDRWVMLRLAIFAASAVYAVVLAHSHLHFVLAKFKGGWPSQVMLTKYTEVATYALSLSEKYRAVPLPGMDDLRDALSGITWQTGGLRGLFAKTGSWSTLALIFGEPVGWRWLLPLRPGGLGDALRPGTFHAGACEAWAALRAALETHHAVMGEVQKMMAAQSACMEAMVTSAAERAASALGHPEPG